MFWWETWSVSGGSIIERACLLFSVPPPWAQLCSLGLGELCSQSTLYPDSPKSPMIVDCLICHSELHYIFGIHNENTKYTFSAWDCLCVEAAGMHIKNKHMRTTVIRQGLWVGSWNMYVEAMGKLKAVVSKVKKLYIVTKIPKVTVHISKAKHIIQD